MGRLRKMGIPLPKKQIKIPESKYVKEAKRKQDYLMDKIEKLKRIKQGRLEQMDTEIFFAKQDYNDHMKYDVQQMQMDGVHPEDIRNHIEYLGTEYLALKDDIKHKYFILISIRDKICYIN